MRISASEDTITIELRVNNLADDILVGFYCDVDGDDTIKMDENELKYAEWVSRKEIELQPNDYSLTNEMMKLFKSGGI